MDKIKLPGTLWTTLIVAVALAAQAIWGTEPVLEVLDEAWAMAQIMAAILLAVAKALQVAREEVERARPAEPTRAAHVDDAGQGSLFVRWLLG